MFNHANLLVIKQFVNITKNQSTCKLRIRRTKRFKKAPSMSRSRAHPWLFVRNDTVINEGAAIISSRTGNLVPMTFKPTLKFARVAGPWAIYKWVKENA